MKISKIKLQNFKSIKDAEIELKDINILIGANGAGKSNFISFFELMDKLRNDDVGSFERYTEVKGGASRFLHFGPKVSNRIIANLFFGHFNIVFGLHYTANDLFSFSQSIEYQKKYESVNSNLDAESIDLLAVLFGSFDFFRVYHFNDTSFYSGIKTIHRIDDNRFLRNDASNIAPYLYILKRKKPNNYERIVDYLKLVAPFFGKFLLEPLINNPDSIKLEWNEVGSDVLFNAHDMSDGTLRFICLATLLLQPEPPETIIIDEPELGLHPFAISILAEMIKKASAKSQIIVSTQSVTLIDNFSPEDIIVVDKKGSESKFRRVGKKELSDWLEEYSLGEIWEKNIIGGRP